METKKSTLKPSLVYSYALGDFCFTFFIMFIGYYLMYYLTDVIKFDTTTAAYVYTTVQIFETIGVIIGGFIQDRVRFKGGRFRPWASFGSLWCAVMLVVLFTKYNIPLDKYTWVFMLLYMIAYWGYNFMWVAFRALPGMISRNQNDVMALAIASQQMAVAAALVYSAVGSKILYGFKKIETGFTVSALVYGCIIILCMFVVTRVTKPYDNDETTAYNDKVHEKASIKDTLKCFTGPMVPFFIANVLRNSVSVAIPALMVYYFKYVLGNSEGVSIYQGALAILQVAAVLLIKPLSRKLSKIFIYIATAVFSAVSLVLAFFLGKELIPFVVLMGLNNFFLVIAGSITNAFITDIADYNEYVRGMGTRGFTVSLSGTANTCASLIGGAIASFSLVLIGYDATVETVSDGLALKIRLIVTLGTALMTGLSIVPFLFYKLNDKKMKEVYELKDKALQVQEQELQKEQ